MKEESEPGIFELFKFILTSVFQQYSLLALYLCVLLFQFAVGLWNTSTVQWFEQQVLTKKKLIFKKKKKICAKYIHI